MSNANVEIVKSQDDILKRHGLSGAFEDFESPDETIAHYGVMGMQWGVRKEKLTPNKSDSRTTKRVKADYNNLSDPVLAKKNAKLDAKFEKKADKFIRSMKPWNEAADAMNSIHIDRINNSPKYKGKDFSKPSALRTAYYKEYSNTFAAEYKKSLERHLGATNPSETREWVVKYDVANQMFPTVSLNDIKHDGLSIPLDVEWSEDGRILKISLPDNASEMITGLFNSPEDVLEHYGLLDAFLQFDSADDVLEHYGIMGMKWGRRKDDPGGPGYGDESKGKTASEFRKKASEQAKKVANRTALAAKAANTRRFDEKDPRQFDDAELERRIQRLQKEQKYREMNSSSIDRGRVIAGNVLKTAGVAAATALITAGMIYVGKAGTFKGLAKAKKIGPAKAAKILKGVFPKDKIDWAKDVLKDVVT